MPRIHDFFLLRRPTELYKPGVHFNSSDVQRVELQDDMYCYIGDSLKWIETRNPARRGETGVGLNSYGPTEIHGEGALLMGRIFASWANLFRNGPGQPQLTGLWRWQEGQSAASGSYERLTFERDPLVKSMDRISAMAERAGARAAEGWLILDQGI